jgi:hypothetical protein
MCTTRRRASVSLQARLRNPSQTCFHVKQTARTRRVSHADLPPSVLWHNRQIEAHLVLRPKLRNRRGDFEAQITKSELSVLRPKSGNPAPTHHLGFEAQPRNPPPVLRQNREKPSPPVLRSNWRKPSHQVLRPNRQKPSPPVLRPNRRETVRVVLRPNHSQTIDLGFEAQPKNPHS